MKNGNKKVLSKVYVVDSGDYEHRSIDGIFSDRSEAREFAAEVGEDSSVTAWAVDDRVGWITRKVYFCRLNLSDSSVRLEGEHGGYLPMPPDKMPRCGAGKITDGDVEVMSESPFSANHARRMAVEARQKYLGGCDGE